MTKAIKINVLSPGRFHVCDLARELDKNGYDVKFYSYVPSKRVVKFGLPAKCNKPLTYLMIPFLALERRLFKRQVWSRNLRILVQDIATALYMRKADVVIAMSGVFYYSLKVAQKKGSLVILERGSKHILEQKRILETIPSLQGKKPISDFDVKRELKGYQLADYISVATQHVRRSFLKYNYPDEKIFVNPYGVNLSMFYPIENSKKQYDVIMVGGWSYQKGCDLIIDAVNKLKCSFVHLGATSDIDFPKNDHFTDIGPVDEAELVKYYNQAKVAVLPSRQEGLAMVQAQAIACNLPLVGSPDSGAEDLKAMVANPEYIEIIEKFTADSVAESIRIALAKYENMGTTKYAGQAITNLTWDAYGRRYSTFLNQIAKQ